MSLELFLHQLHFDVEKTKPPDVPVDWEDGPLPYKLYRGLPTMPLSSDIPLSLDGAKDARIPNLRTIGHFLWYSFGLTQLTHAVFASVPADPSMGMLEMYRRFAPSGGALYPIECYLYLKIERLPTGIYHYDVAHHRLVLLREGCFDSYLARAIGDQCDMSACFGAVFVSTMFWKNFFKYNHFSYRLQGLDAGASIGQLLEVAKRFGYSSGVVFRFLDRAINHLLGLSEGEESVYAVIPLSQHPAARWFAVRKQTDESMTAFRLSRELAPVRHDHYVRSRRIKPFPLLIQMNEASMLESLYPLHHRIQPQQAAPSEIHSVVLPNVKRLSFDLASACRNRYSPDRDFVLGNVSQRLLAELLLETTASFSYANDLDGADSRSDPRVSLYACTHNVEGVPDGAYGYEPHNHALRRVRSGDQRPWLQLGMSADNVNLFQVPLCFHVAGDNNHLLSALGFRGYRIQQMEAGMLLQRLLLSASAIGLGGHPLLGYDAKLSDDIYKLPGRSLTSLIQIPVGPYSPGARLSGGLHG